MDELMKIKANDKYLAEPEISVADFYLVPIVNNINRALNRDEFLALPCMDAW